MKNSKVLATALLVALLVLPLYTSGEASISYIEIKNPVDGQTVHDSTELVVVAEGYSLRDPHVSIMGEKLGTSYPLSGCTFVSPIKVGDESEIISSPGMTMSCNADINLKSFIGEEVKITVSVFDNGKKIMDSVGLYVSGQCV